MFRPGQLSLIGLPPLVAAELRWGLHQHAIGRDRARWMIGWLNRTVTAIRVTGVTSLMDLSPESVGPHVRMVCQEIRAALSTIYLTVEETKTAGFIETDQFGRRFPRAVSRYDLSGVQQRWLRDLLWDHLVGRLKSPTCPRTRGSFDDMRRATLELSAWLAATAPDHGHNPRLLDAADADMFVADQRHRGRHGLPALGTTLRGGKPTHANDYTVSRVFNGVRTLLGEALVNGDANVIGLRRGFINAIPAGGTVKFPPRSPFSDEVARALAAEENLRTLATRFDPYDRGLRDVWETLVLSGRRTSEVLGLRLDCIGHYSGLAMLWHDQTKVGNLNAGIRIPERLYQLLDHRRATTLALFEQRNGRPPTTSERAALALFPRYQRNRTGTQAIGYAIFSRAFKAWVDSLDIGGAVAHQARHTLATRLLRHGATLAHIRQYLGHVSEQMAEHYAHVSSTDLDDVLARVWVTGPGTDQPGTVLSIDPAGGSAPDALVLAIDLSRRATPTDGGFCTYQPVVDGGACPRKLDCESCDKFVLSGADLVYWRRKREQWYSLAERAPDETTAAYLHHVFAPTAAAIDGLEKALAAAGLLDQALAVDLRRPQDYFHRVWSTAFPAADLARLGTAG